MTDHTSGICPKCRGDGVLINRAAQIATGLISFGMFPLLDAALSNSKADSEYAYKCPTCKGSGWVRQRYRP